jgi:hypothetical protein
LTVGEREPILVEKDVKRSGDTIEGNTECDSREEQAGRAVEPERPHALEDIELVPHQETRCRAFCPDVLPLVPDSIPPNICDNVYFPT